MIQKKNTSGGAAGAGGFNFQAAITAIAYVHSLRGTPVQWTKGLTASPPVGVLSETGGPGDDISLELADRSTVEVQVKKRLRATKAFWSVIDSLSEGIDSDLCTYGVLIVCSSSSNIIHEDFAKAIKKIGEENYNHPSDQQSALTEHLRQKGYDPAKICARLRIQAVAALSDHRDAIAAAHAELGHICADTSQIPSAWSVLYENASEAIGEKGRRTSSSLVKALQTSSIAIKSDENDSPAAISQALLKWIDTTTEKFSVLGIHEPLSTDTAWLQLQASVGDEAIKHDSSIEDALHAYHALSERSASKGENSIDAKTIGTFRKHCVIVGGPGSGKSLLLQVLAREFGKDAFVSLRVKLRDLDKRIETTGCTVEEGLLSLGLGGSGISPEQLRSAGFSDLVFLCDGLDECGKHQADIASGLKAISVSSPSSRIIVTTRPIGYDTSELRPWRHYGIKPLNPDEAANQLETLCRGVLGTVSDSEDQLRADIDTYMKASGVRKFISRSPLLLAFAAALILKRKTIGESKTDLYARIFKLIDDAPDPRKGSALAIPRAFRDRVLDHLGWLANTSPLLTAEEIEEQCAKNIERGSDKPYLESLSLAQNSITYWEEAGLIERISHSGQDLITFIHKTCGEFAAARYLATIDETEVRQLIEKEFDNPDWEEILDFATQTSVAEMIADVIIDRANTAELSSRLIDRAFHVLARPEICLNPPKLDAFLERMFALAQAEDRQKAYRVGVCMANNDMSHVSEVAERSEQLLTAQAEWSRLIGWTVLVCHFPDRLDYSELENKVLYYAALSNDDNLFIRSNHEDLLIRPMASLLYEGPDEKIFELFLINALEVLLENLTVARQDKLIAAVGKLRGLLSLGSISRLESLLHRIGRRDALSMFGEMFRTFNWSTSEFDASHRTLFQEVLVGAFVAEEVLTPPNTGMKHFGAFLQLAQVMKATVDDVKIWSDIGDFSHVQDLLRVAAIIFGLSPERLAAEVQYFYEGTGDQKRFRECFYITGMVPSVDAPKVHWERAKQVEFDNMVLEELVHHPSSWLKSLAAYVLYVRMSGTERFEAYRRMLETGQNQTLRIAAIMAAELPDHKGHELILARLREPLKPGAHYLFEQLAKDEFPIKRSHSDVLELGLMSSSAKMAEFAAKWCGASADGSEAWLRCLLRRAFEYWAINEQPYPESGGVVPDSPRGELYCALRAIDNFKFNELAELAMDRRSDVSGLAMQDLFNLVSRSDDDRNQLVGELCKKRFSLSLCAKFLDVSIPYSQDNLTALCALLKDVNPGYRRVAIRVLSHPNMDQAKAQRLAIQRKDDADGTVRDAAYKCLDTLKQIHS